MFIKKGQNSVWAFAHWHGHFSASVPSKLFRKYVLLPCTTWITNGHFHRKSNFLCFPLSSLLESHFKTLFPMNKSSSFVLLSNIFFNFSCKIWFLWYTSSLVCCKWMVWFILLWISLGFACIYCSNLIVGIPKDEGNLASMP